MQKLIVPAGVLVVPPSPLPCPPAPFFLPSTSTPLRDKLGAVKAVFVATFANPHVLKQEDGKVIAERIECHLEAVLKNDPFLEKKKVVMVEGAFNVANWPKPKRMLVAADIHKGNLDP